MLNPPGRHDLLWRWLLWLFIGRVCPARACPARACPASSGRGRGRRGAVLRWPLLTPVRTDPVFPALRPGTRAVSYRRRAALRANRDCVRQL